MGRFVKGDVVVTPFPFSDLQAAKRRPALVVATFTGDDVLLCQIISQAVSDSYAIPLRSTDFTRGRLDPRQQYSSESSFTADSNIILYRAGVLPPAKLQEVIAKIITIVST
jgi:mRNA interferase MazF